MLDLTVSMTKVLSQLLGAQEPSFRLGLRQLEQASGHAGEDVRLTSDVMRQRRACLRDLHLDPDDTTGRELYAALMQRVHDDNAAFERLLDDGHGQSNIMPQVGRLVQSMDIPQQIFGLRAASAKKLLRAHPPKKALKQLGYRSIDSVLKHEPCALLFAAAAMAEAAPWHRSMQAAYKRLAPADFETRQVLVVAPESDRWRKLSLGFMQHYKHNVIAFRELGAVVLLPLDAARVPASSLAATLLTLQAVNDIRAASTYLKLHLVRPDFGEVVARIARNEPVTQAQLGGSALPWKLVHQYFARHPDAYNPHLFEPHVHHDDLQWHSAEAVLADLHPRFEFWRDSGCSGLLEKGEAVSLNLLDTVLGFCNRRPYEKRVLGHGRDRLWHELLLRYMRQSGIEREVHDQLTGELAGMPELEPANL